MRSSVSYFLLISVMSGCIRTRIPNTMCVFRLTSSESSFLLCPSRINICSLMSPDWVPPHRGFDTGRPTSALSATGSTLFPPCDDSIHGSSVFCFCVFFASGGLRYLIRKAPTTSGNNALIAARDQILRLRLRQRTLSGEPFGLPQTSSILDSHTVADPPKQYLFTIQTQASLRSSQDRIEILFSMPLCFLPPSSTVASCFCPISAVDCVLLNQTNLHLLVFVLRELYFTSALL